MERQKRTRRIGPAFRAFTLVELLVVITIIGMLIGLLIPAIQAAMEIARQAKCRNNEKQIALAMAGFESSHRSYPGWQNTVSGASGAVSWPSMLLPYMERQDLWKVVKSGGSYTGTVLQTLICPTDPPAVISSAGPSAYVANGLVLRDQAQYAANPKANGALAPQSAEYVSNNDGLTNTLMLGENTQAPPIAAAAAGALGKAHNWYDVAAVASGINPQLAQTFGYPIAAAVYDPNLVKFAGAYGTQTGFYNGNVMTANINSGHSGGAVVAFFDGHAIFLSESAGLNNATNSTSVSIYQILATPEGSKIGGEPAADEGQWP